MNKRSNSIITAGLLASVLLAASPFALADHHGDRKGHHGKQDMAEMCEDFREGKGRFDQEKREQRRAEMAERLQLTDEQLEIWADIHEEHREKHEQRREKMKEKIQERCDALEK